MAKKKQDVPSVLAFEKKLVPSDGYMYGCKWENRNKALPLALNEKSVRGTISNRLKMAISKDPAKLNQKVENPNLQKVDACSLGIEQDTLKLCFTLKVLGGLGQPSACNNPDFKQQYQEAVESYINKHGMKELGKRYALNIANARFLWRNRIGAERILVEVKALSKGGEEAWEFNALEFTPRDMETTTSDVDRLASCIASALASEDDFLMLDITCYAKVGKAQDVYPSEELIMDKESGNKKGEKKKILYAVDGVAAMHSQKLGNALRTIDTWYPGNDDKAVYIGPIPIEPYGAVTHLGKAFRSKQNFYSLFDDQWICNEELSIEDKHYIVAILVRGGIFGASSKEKE